MLFFSGDDWDKRLTDDQLRVALQRLTAWTESLAKSGKIRGGNALARDGKVVVGKERRVISDGPYPETKEALGGYLLLAVETMDEAVAIARSCPGLDQGGRVEVREVVEQCPVMERIQGRLGLETAFQDQVESLLR